MSGRDWLNIIGHAAVVDGSGVHRPLFQWVLSHSILQNESRGYAIALESSLGLHHCCAMPGPPIGRVHSPESLQHPDFYNYLRLRDEMIFGMIGVMEVECSQRLRPS